MDIKIRELEKWTTMYKIDFNFDSLKVAEWVMQLHNSDLSECVVFIIYLSIEFDLNTHEFENVVEFLLEVIEKSELLDKNQVLKTNYQYFKNKGRKKSDEKNN